MDKEDVCEDGACSPSLCSNKLSTHNPILHFHIYFDLS
jgi:hypothetical protein